MKKQVKKLISITMAAMCMAGMATVYAAEADNSSAAVSVQESGVSPYFVAISDCSRLLRKESSLGKFLCSGDTNVYEGYTAEVVVELQKYDGGWSTIKTWRDKPGSTYATVDEYYYVAKGKYKLKVTHRAYKSGKVADTFVAYSDEVTY